MHRNRCIFVATRLTGKTRGCLVQLMFKTTDSGATWTQQTGASSLPNQPILRAISFLDANVFYAVGSAGT